MSCLQPLHRTTSTPSTSALHPANLELTVCTAYVLFVVLPVFLYCSWVLKWDRHYDPDMDDRHKTVQLAKFHELSEGA
jgi:hypothetical protein